MRERDVPRAREARAPTAGGRRSSAVPTSEHRRRARRRSGRRRATRRDGCVLRLERAEEATELVRCVRPSRRRGRTTEAPAARAVGYDTPVPTAPLVSVLVAVHDGEPYVRTAVASVLRQTRRRSRARRRRRRLVATRTADDARRASTTPRVRVLRNEEQLGLAASLNAGSTRRAGATSRGMDADDVALPDWLERQLELLESRPDLAARRRRRCSTSTRTAARRDCTIHDAGARRACAGARSSARRSSTRRWCSSASCSSGTGSATTRRSARARTTSSGRGCSPSPTATTSRSRSCSTACTRSRRRSAAATLQRDAASARSRCGRSRRVAPELSPEQRELAWRVGSAPSVAAARRRGRRRRRSSSSCDASRPSTRPRGELRRARARPRARSRAALARAGRRRASFCARPAARSRCSRLTWPRVARRRRTLRSARSATRPTLLRALAAAPDAPPIRVTAVFPEPTPYRAPLLDRVAALPEIELTVVYAARTVAGRTWRVEPEHRAVFLRGLRVPGAARVLRHDYPLTPGVVRALERARPGRRRRLGLEHVRRAGGDRLVPASGASRTSCSSRATTRGRAPGWRRAVKGTVVPAGRARRRGRARHRARSRATR